MSDRGHSDEEGRSSLERRSARPYRFANRGRTVRIAVSDLRGKMLRIEQVLGSRLDPALAERIHELEQQGAVDFLTVPIADVSRHRFRTRTKGGTEVAIALTRDQRLFDGAVLVLKPDHAVVVRVAQERWLRLQPCAIADAIELGYHAGNLHWRVRFNGEGLLVAMEAPMDEYLTRLGALIRDRRVISSVAAADEVIP
jgi:urease accessory protein